MNRSRAWSWLPLLPEEHGAWGSFLFPLLGAISLGWGPTAGLPLALGLATFLGLEPVQRLVGRRARAISPNETRQAWGALTPSAVLVAVALLLPWGKWPLGAGLAVVLLLHAGAAVAVWQRRERSFLGEGLGGALLASWGTLLVAARGGSTFVVVAHLLVWTVASLLAVAAVRAVIRGFKRLPRALELGWLVAAWLTGLGLAVASASARPWLGALLPVGLTSLGLVLLAPHPRYLRRVGWALVGAHLATAASVALALRGALGVGG